VSALTQVKGRIDWICTPLVEADIGAGHPRCRVEKQALGIRKTEAVGVAVIGARLVDRLGPIPRAITFQAWRQGVSACPAPEFGPRKKTRTGAPKAGLLGPWPTVPCFAAHRFDGWRAPGLDWPWKGPLVFNSKFYRPLAFFAPPPEKHRSTISFLKGSPAPAPLGRGFFEKKTKKRDAAGPRIAARGPQNWRPKSGGF